MDRVIYSKFSYERRPKLDIRTNIAENDNGVRYVEKIPYTAEAAEHVDKICQWYEALTKCFDDTRFTANSCEKTANGVRFEYLKGTSMERLLDGFICRGEIEKARVCIDEYVTEIRKAYGDTRPFAAEEAFAAVFGEAEFKEPPVSARFVDIDLIFQNILIQDNSWYVIDYEWTFDFFIPVNFIIYRALFYYTYQNEDRKVIDTDGLFEKYGISPAERETYRRMEDFFQRVHLQGDYHPLRNMNVSAGKNVMMMARIDDRCNAVVLSRDIQLYYSFGEAFVEERSRRFPYEEGEESIVEDELPAGVKKLRVDLSDERCIIRLLEFSVYDGEWYEPHLEATNGRKTPQDTYAFTEDDGWFIFEELHENSTRFRVRFVKEPVAELTENEKEDLHKEIRELEQTLADVREELKHVTAHRDSLDQHRVQMETRIYQLEKDKSDYNDMVEAYRDDAAEWNRRYLMVTGSFSWRVTKPLRKVIDQMKRMKQKNLGKTLEKEFNDRCSEIGREQALNELKTSLLQEYQEFFAKPDHVGTGDVKFSFILPVYNISEELLRRTIQMLYAQTYENWELIIADYSDVEHGYAEHLCRWLETKLEGLHYWKAGAGQTASEAYQVSWKQATGDYIGIIYPGDIMAPTMLEEMAKCLQQKQWAGIYCDEGVYKERLGDTAEWFYKPDFSPDTLAGRNYIGQMCFLKKTWILESGGFDPAKAGAQMYDLLLKASSGKQQIGHVKKCLYYHRKKSCSWIDRLETEKSLETAEKEAITEYAARIGYQAKVERTDSAYRTYHVSYELKEQPLISIIIPNKDHTEDLDHCIKAIDEKSTYRNYEFIIVENCSEKPETFSYYRELEKRDNVKVVFWKNGFNYSQINNFGFQHAKGEYMLLLNNDIEVITPGWMEEMLMYVQREDVGAAGAMLYYPDDTVQHAGVILGLNGVAGHSHRNYRRHDEGYMGRLKMAQNLTAVTAACLLVKREAFEKVHGLDKDFRVAFNDVDFCVKIREAGYLIVFTPFAELYHYESKSRGLEDSPEKVKRFMSEILTFKEKWKTQLEEGDPYYNPNLVMDKEDFTVADPADYSRK